MEKNKFYILNVSTNILHTDKPMATLDDAIERASFFSRKNPDMEYVIFGPLARVQADIPVTVSHIDHKFERVTDG